MVERTQSGTFVGGLMRGWEFGKGIQRREAQEERRQAQFENEQELNALNTEAAKIELEDAKAQRRRDQALRHLNTATQAYEAGNKELAAKEFEEGIGTLDMSVEDFSPEFVEAATTLEREMKEPGSVGDRKAIEAANRVFRNQVKKGVGEQTTRDGKTVTITDKEITEVAPSPTDDGQGNAVEPGIMARMRVTGETEDGETVTWRAPLTANRSSRDDDPAQSVPMDEIAKQVAGKRSLMTGLAKSPGFRDMLRMARTRAGGEAAEREQPEYGTTEIKQGDKIVTMITEDGRPTQPLAEAPRWKQEAAGGDGVGGVGGDGLNASDENTIYRQTANLFGGMYDPQTGELTGLTQENATTVQGIAARASQMLNRGEADTRSEAVTLAARERGINIEGLRSREPSRTGRDASVDQGAADQSTGSSGSSSQGTPGRNEASAGSNGAVDGDALADLERRMTSFGQNVIDSGGADPQRVQRLRDQAIRAIQQGKQPDAVVRRFMEEAEKLRTDGRQDRSSGHGESADTGSAGERAETASEASTDASGESGGPSTSQLRRALSQITGNGGESNSAGGLPGNRARFQGGEATRRNLVEPIAEFLSRSGGDRQMIGPEGGTPRRITFRDPESGQTVTGNQVRRLADRNGLSVEAVVERLGLERVEPERAAEAG